MKLFRKSMYPHLCYLLPETDSADLTASVVEGFPATSGLTPVPCRVRLTRTMPGMGGDREIGSTDADVAFPVNPNVAKGTLLKRTSDGLILRCLGAAKDRATGFNFVVSCMVIE